MAPDGGGVVVLDRDWAAGAAGRVRHLLAEALAETGGTVSVALAGGSTPEPVYGALARDRTIPWNRIELWFGDERCVPPEHPDSNYRMVRRALLEPGGVPPDRVRRLEAEGPDRERAAAAYGDSLPDRLDLLLLGIGGDGHTASLFPGSPALEVVDRRVVEARAPEAPVCRLTVTPPVIRSARTVVVLARGEGKAPAVAAALDPRRSVRECPAGLARHGLWLLDPEAAGRLDVRASGKGAPSGAVRSLSAPSGSAPDPRNRRS